MRKVLRILAIIYASYLALALLVITPALNLLPPWLAKKYLDREYHSEFVWFNPFTLSLELYETQMPERDGERFASLERASVNLSLASLYKPGIVFDKLEVIQLFLHVVQKPDGNFNFTDLLPPEDPAAPPPEPAGIPAVTIDDFHFSSEQLMYTDQTREKPYSSELNGLDLSVLGLSTVLEEGKPYSLDATGEAGGQLHWKGEVSIPRGYSKGTLALTDLHLPALWRIAEPWVAFELTQGKVSVEGQYSVDWSEAVKYQVGQGEFRLDEVAVAPKAGIDLPDTSVSLGSLRLDGIELDGPAQHVNLQSLVIKELAVNGWSEGADASLSRLFAVALPEAEEDPSAAQDSSDEGSWTALLGSVQLADSKLRWRSEFTNPGLLEVSPLEAEASSIKWPLEGDTELSLSLSVNGEASTSVQGTLDLAQGVGKLNYELESLPIPWFNPNFPAALNVKITDGRLQVKGDITLADFAPGLISMDGSIDGFAGAMTDTEESLTSWETVRWETLRLDMNQNTIDLAKLSIDDYKGRIHINKDGSINAQNVWKQEVGDQAKEVKDDLSEGQPWQVQAPLVSITDSEIDFMDESLPINFRTVIGDINGHIKNISSEAGAKTQVDIKGSVDGYAPVTLGGTAQPLRSPPAIDLGLNFSGLDMALLSPYSGTYAGYSIEQGVLNLDLKYAMEENQLKGHNKIVIDNMKLGEKVESEDAVDLPIELALALLTDSNGIIDMDIPVSGDVDDPEFNVGSVVFGAVVNLITKVVTSPFTLLAGLVDSEEDLQRINFKSGSAEVDEISRKKLDDLNTALQQRPELGLVITGRLQLQADRERLQKNLLKAELLQDGLTQAELDSKGKEWEAAIAARYQSLTPGETELTSGEQYAALAQAMPLDDAALLELATNRAVAVKAYLVTEMGMDADRATIAKSSLDAADNLYSGAELEIDI